MGIMKRLPLLTVPNSLTFLRALGIPLFIYLAIALEADGWAILTLAIGGATDYFDGKIAREWGIVSAFGRFMDSVIDKVLVHQSASTLVAANCPCLSVGHRCVFSTLRHLVWVESNSPTRLDATRPTDW